MSPPLVTALIDTFNYGHFVEEAIESVLAQDYPSSSVEVLVIDDGSTDDTAERVNKYGSRIRYFRKQNGGQASAFNFGFGRASGDIIAFLDADDYWMPGKLSAIVRAFEQHSEVGLVYHRRKELNSATGEFTEGNFAQCSGYLPDSLKQMLEYRVLPTSSLSFRRNILSRIMPIPDWIKLQADAYMALLAVFVAPVYSVPDILSVYRLHGKNLYAADSQTLAQSAEHIDMRRKIAGSTQMWLRDNHFDLHRMETKAYFEQLSLALAADEFEIKPPTRVELFSHMLRRNRLYRSQYGWKLRLMNFFNLITAPLVGYRRFKEMYKKEVRVMTFLQQGRSRHA